jgi:hypothetical protein
MNISVGQLNNNDPLSDIALDKANDICMGISDKISQAHTEGRLYVDVEIVVTDNMSNVRGMQKMVTSFVITKIEGAGFNVKGFKHKNKIVWRINGWEGFTEQQLNLADKFIDSKIGG